MKEPTIWENLYFATWSGILPEGGYYHPAKFAPGLISRIYEYLQHELRVPVGATVLDPFAGVGTGSLYAMLRGYNWVGMEIESHFAQDANQNINLWRKRYENHYPDMGQAVVFNRDSRLPFTSRGEAIVSSPPFSTGETRNRTKYQDGEIASMMSRAYTADNQGTSDDNLASLPDKNGDYEAVVSSPPYEDVIGKGEGPGARWDNVYHSKENAHKISSLPSYGDEERQVGNTSGQTFWDAAEAIVQNCYKALRSESYAIWVCKDYIRKGQRVPFSDRWQALNEQEGFVLHERIRGSLVQDDGEQLDIFGELHSQGKERKSLFRRLAEAKGSPRIDYEDIIVMRRP